MSTTRQGQPRQLLETSVQPKVYHATDHDIDPTAVDSHAVEIIDRLRNAGYEAYLVGGSVRDLLRRKVPKDFDISTSATPEEIKAVFRRSCLLIGRRFRLAHIRYGTKIFEVSTFRSGENENELIVRDNQWGTAEQDVLRRDFTINGLFYDPSTHEVIDYVGGWDDVHRERLCTIGDANVRFCQDPVRMIRALKFQARFDYAFDASLEGALHSCRDEITKSAPARVLEEMLRMLESGASKNFFSLLTTYGFTDIIFPFLGGFLEGINGEQIYDYLEVADECQRSKELEGLERPVLTSCLLFPILQQEIQQQFLDKGETPHLGDIALLTSSLIEGVVTSSFSHFPRRISGAMNMIMATQYRFTPLTSRRHYKPKLLRDRDMPLALSFLKIRAILDPSLVECYEEWAAIHEHVIHNQRRRPHSPPKRRRRRRRPTE